MNYRAGAFGLPSPSKIVQNQEEGAVRGLVLGPEDGVGKAQGYMWLVTRLSTESAKGGKTLMSRVVWICQLLDDGFLYTFSMTVTVGVLALQGAFREHLQLLREAAQHLSTRWRDGNTAHEFEFKEVRNAQQLSSCDALIIPGGESTTMSLVAAESNLLEPLRQFVK